MKGWAVFFLLVGWVWGQHRHRSERLHSLRIAFLTEEMGLMPEEAQAFWPVYNAREAELQKSRQNLRERWQMLQGVKDQMAPTAYADSVAVLYLELWQKEAEIRRTYHEKFKKVLPPQKLARFYWAETRMLRRALAEEGWHPPRE
ncbi:MAG: hypothetical protein NZ580_07825 [Bacteroidia bacterium]|nr:hypothetical protein [Bacteroidia bacterium]MDW8236638.1 hypothetical protein [Bacteroidia bacterium]